MINIKQVIAEDIKYKQDTIRRNCGQAKRITQGENVFRDCTHIRNTNISSSAILIVALICLLVFLSYAVSTANAQENPSITSGENGGGLSMEIAYLVSAVNAMKDNDSRMAMHWFEASADSNPEFAPPYIGIAHIHFLSGNYQLSLHNAVLAQQLNPHDGSVYYVLGEVQCALGNFDAAFYNYIVYLIYVETLENQPILIRRMIGENSMTAIHQSLTSCANDI